MTALEYLDVVTCTYTNTQEAIMPLNKLINGCQPNANENSNKCGDFPAFTFNLYLQNPTPVADPLNPNSSHTVPFALPTPFGLTPPPFPGGNLATVTAPPRIDLPGPTGVPFSVCEMGIPEAWENMSWTVEITMYGSNKPDQVITYYPYDPTRVRPDFYNPDYFLFGVQGVNSGNRCINITIPLGADRFEIFVDNVTGRGRMTGGGSVFTTLNQQSNRVTHGFELHCNANDAPNHLEINWNGNRFHLQSLSSAKCSTDRRLDGPNRPAAGFNTYEGTGTGRLNGQSGYKAAWGFTDAGEPGTSDTAALRITNSNGDVILSVGSINFNGNGGITNSTGTAVTFGNHQAHK
jgi:hypothetical protein